MRSFERNDRDIRSLRKEIAILEQLERRGGITLVMQDDVLITAYHVGKGNKR